MILNTLFFSKRLPPRIIQWKSWSKTESTRRRMATVHLSSLRWCWTKMAVIATVMRRLSLLSNIYQQPPCYRMRHCSLPVVVEQLTSKSIRAWSKQKLAFSHWNTISFILRRGARHGLKLSGKLNRIEEQERQLLEKYSNSFSSETATEVSHI